MSYHALYRAYRPKRFCEVIGQEHITTVLKNQIVSGRTAHAYLFCGTRGTGKTSTAKILARAVNCLHLENGEPCMACEACLRDDEANVDIIELDAASNNGVDDMRALIEKARFTPLHLKMKVYIIDEAHMLSQSAFNALLKTLEEPPAHIMFILATTEPQRIPATIISRCQRFDFHRLKVSDILSRLQSVLSSAGAEMDEAGMLAIARAAQGGMRDALSLADQCISFCGRAVTAQDVYEILGSMDEDFLFRMVDAIIDSDAAGALRLFDKVVNDGRDMNVFVRELSMHFRALLLAVNCGSCAEILECTEDMMQRYLAQAKRCAQARMLRCIELLLRTQSNMKWLTSPRALIEATLVRACHPYAEQDVSALLDRIETLEKRMESGDALRMQAVSGPKNASMQVVRTDVADAFDQFDIPLPEEPSMQEAVPEWEDPAFEEPVLTPVREMPHIPVHTADTAAVKRLEVVEKASVSAPQKAAAVPSSLQKAGSSDVNAMWKRVLDGVRKKNLVLYTYLLKAGRVWLEGTMLHAGFDSAAMYHALKSREHTELIKGVMDELFPSYGFMPTLADSDEFLEDRVRAMFADKTIVIS